jgi:hypothetical protein
VGSLEVMDVARRKSSFPFRSERIGGLGAAPPRRGYTPSPQELTLSQLQSAIYLRDRHDEIDD